MYHGLHECDMEVPLQLLEASFGTTLAFWALASRPLLRELWGRLSSLERRGGVGVDDGIGVGESLWTG